MKNYIENIQKIDCKFIDEVSLWSAPFGMKLLEKVKLKRKMNVLDIGFGLGFPTIELANRLGSSSKVYGIDPWMEASERAQAKIDYFKIKNIEIIEGVAERIPLQNKTIDLIVSNNGLNNVNDLKTVIQEINRISKKGAQLVASFNLSGTMYEFYSIYKDVLNDLKMNEYISKIDEHINNKRPPVEKYTDLLAINGFETKHIYYNEFKYRFIDGSTMFNYPLIRYAFMESWISLIPDNFVDTVFSEIEMRMNIISEKNGEWVLSVPFATLDSEKR